eukprot:TRINITY_DN1193_c0_g1_i1.p1 TRINITY_DN1193_c0_g1~~TRINITY_DN1193_c0_g1_i1.p1  ORF type:complete len:209 (+),score=75.18 TRINITY_DN1193_c0_g1_i1:46-627(+)
MLRSLVGSEMCIRDRYQRRVRGTPTTSMPARSSRWTNAPSALHAKPTTQQQAAAPVTCRPVDLVTPLPGRKKMASRFDPVTDQCNQENHAPQPAHAPAEPAAPARPQISASPPASVDLIKNKGGQEERDEFKAQMEKQAAARTREFHSKLEDLKKADKQESTMGSDPYERNHESSVRDRLESLKTRFDSALNK